MRHPTIGALAVAIAVLAAGCGDDGGSGAPATTVGGVELAFEPDEVSAAPGPLALTFENRGALPHNLVFEEETGLVAAGLTEFVEGGEKATYELELVTGTFEFFCSVPGHRDAGMEGTLVVG